MNADDWVLVERRGHVARMVLNRPARLNALALPEGRQALNAVLNQLEADDEVHVAILTGAGDRAFCTGWDMESIGELNQAELEAVIRDNLLLFLQLWQLRQPVIAAINGYALGAGAGLAMACDLAIAAEHARLGEPEIRHYALSPFMILPFLTHSRAVHEYYYIGDMLDAAAMLRLGLVNQVVPGDELETAAWAMAERLARVPPFAVQMKKRSLRQAYELMGLGAAVRQNALADALVIGANLPEQKALLDLLVQEGMRAFLQARDGPFEPDARR
jgi:enoyl-CoA hydratase/carnithine racemase